MVDVVSCLLIMNAKNNTKIKRTVFRRHIQEIPIQSLGCMPMIFFRFVSCFQEKFCCCVCERCGCGNVSSQKQKIGRVRNEVPYRMAEAVDEVISSCGLAFDPSVGFVGSH